MCVYPAVSVPSSPSFPSSLCLWDVLLLCRSFGIQHDGNGNDCEPIGKRPFVMSPQLLYGTVSPSWSLCSRQYITRFLEWVAHACDIPVCVRVCVSLSVCPSVCLSVCLTVPSGFVSSYSFCVEYFGLSCFSSVSFPFLSLSLSLSISLSLPLPPPFPPSFSTSTSLLSFLYILCSQSPTMFLIHSNFPSLNSTFIFLFSIP